MSETMLAIVIAIVAAVVVVAIFWILWSRRQSRKLREGFGPEYDHVVEERGDRKAAEKELNERRKRVEEYDLRPLDRKQRTSFDRRWQDVQKRFVDSPSAAIADAQELVEEVMLARGYPLGDIKQQEADVSVEAPGVVGHFRRARAIAERNERGEATTEDLRQGMKHYRELFDSLLEGGRLEHDEKRHKEKVRG